MIFTTFKANNFKALKNVDVEFKKGFNILIGENGQGKSCVLTGLGYLLLNQTPKNETIESLLQWGQQNYSLATSILHDSKKFELKVNFEKGGKSSKLLKVDSKEFVGLSVVKDELAKYFDPVLSKAAMIHTQGENDAVEDTPSDRREYLKKIYDLNFQDQIDIVEEQTKKLNQEIIELGKEIYALDNKTYNINLLPDRPFSDKQYEKYKEEKELLLKKQSEIEEQRRRFTQLKEQLESKKKKLEFVVLQLTTLQQDLTKSQGLIALAKTELAAKNYEEELNSFLQKLPTMFVEAEEEIKSLQQWVDSTVLPRPPKYSDEGYLEATSKQGKLQYEIEQLEKSIVKMKSGVCPTCGQAYEPTTISEAQDKMAELQEELRGIRLLLAEEKQKKDAYEVKRVEHETFVNDFNNKKLQLQQKINTLDTEKVRVETRKKELEKTCQIRKKALEDKIELHNEMLTSTQNRVKDNEQLKAELTNEIDLLTREVGNVEDTWPDFKGDIQSITDSIKSYEDYLTRTKLIKESNELVEREKIEDEKLLKAKCELNDSKVLQVERNKTKVSILKKEFPNFILSQITKQIEDGMNTFLDRTYKGRYHVKIVETKNGISIVYGPNDSEINKASGAEKSLFQLALKIAFTEIAGLGLLILDEIDNFMSDEIAKNVFSVLKEMIDDNELDQVFVVTHSETIKDLFQNTYHAAIFEIQDGEVSET